MNTIDATIRQLEAKRERQKEALALTEAQLEGFHKLKAGQVDAFIQPTDKPKK